MPKNYVMTEGAKKNHIIKIVKRVLLVLGLIALVVFWLRWTSAQDAKAMAVEYCWDYDGNNYVAPNYNCR